MTIDCHSHLYPRSYLDLLRARDVAPRVTGEPPHERLQFFAGEEKTGGRPIDASYWSVEAKLAFMREAGIERSIVSLGNPWLDPLDPADAHAAARDINAELAALGPATGNRLVGLGVLPQDTVAAAVAAAGEIAATPTLYGVANGARMCGRLLDDPDLDPLWQVLERERLPIMVHPHYSVPDPALAGRGATLPLALGFPSETTFAVARLVLGGVLQRFPRLTVVAVHGGGTLPYLAGRLDAIWRADAAAQERLPVPPSEELRKLALDALVYAPGPLAAAAELVGPERLMLGTDHPFDIADPAGNLAAIERVFAGPAAASVRGGTAAALFGLPPLDPEEAA
ncbi:MAG: amidohydrolase family protein [Conexibacter sp.]